MQNYLAWDWASRQGNINTKGLQIEVNAFDYKRINETVYQENDVTIRSIPAAHALDGPVSYIFEWNGLKFIFSSDTYPNKWWLEYTKDSDLEIHQCFISPIQLVTKMHFPSADAVNVGTQGHTAPEVLKQIRSTHQGPPTIWFGVSPRMT